MCTAEGKNKLYELRDGEAPHVEGLVLATLGDSWLSRRSCGYPWHHCNWRKGRVPSGPYSSYHGDHLHRCPDACGHDRHRTEGADAPLRDDPAHLVLGIHDVKDLGQPPHLPGSLAHHAAGQRRTAHVRSENARIDSLCRHHGD